MENSEEGKTGLARVTENTDGTIKVKYDSKEVVFGAYQRGIMSANVEYRSEETFLKLVSSISAAKAAKGNVNEKQANNALETYLEEILKTMEILDIE